MAEATLKEQIIAALGLTEADFSSENGDLIIPERHRAAVIPWLKQNYRFWTLVQRFETHFVIPREG